jgi:hypothetical protein
MYVLWAERERQLSRGLVIITVLSITAWIVTALVFGYITLLSAQCPETETGLGRCEIFGWVGPLALLIGVSVGASVFAALAGLRLALAAEDWSSAACFGVLLGAAAFAVYARLQAGQPGHPVVAALYGFPPERLSLHPLASYCAAALVVLLPLLVLPYALTRGRARRVSAAAGPLLVLIFWLAIRLAG